MPLLLCASGAVIFVYSRRYKRRLVVRSCQAAPVVRCRWNSAFLPLCFSVATLMMEYNQSCRETRASSYRACPSSCASTLFLLFLRKRALRRCLGGDLATCINAPCSSLFPGPFSSTHSSLVLRKIVSMGRAKARFSHIRCRFPSVLGLAVPLVLRAVPCPWAVILQA